MTLPIRVTVPYNAPEHALMLSAIEQLSLDQHVWGLRSITFKGKPRKMSVLLYPTRGAKPFVLRTLREFARIANDWE